MKNISFYFKRKESGLIILFVSYGFKDNQGKYQQLQVSSGLRVNKDYFDPKTGVKNSANLNLRLAIQKFQSDILNKIYDANIKIKDLHTYPPSWIKEAYLKEEAPPSTDLITLSQAIQQFIDKKKNDLVQPLSPVVINSYSNLLIRIKAFKDISLKEINNEYVFSFSNHLIKQGLRINTVLKYFSRLRSVVYSHLPNIKLKLKLEEEIIDKVVFDFDDLELIENYKLENERLNKIRNNFIFQCYTGLRYSDFMQNGEIIHLDNNPYIRILTQKTGNEVVIPLMKNIQRIIKEGKLNYSISNQKYNAYLKELLKIIFPDRTIKIKKSLQGKQVIEFIPIYNLVSTHSGRRSFATNFYLLGFPIKLLMDILGQKSEEVFLRYIQSNKLKQAQTLNKLIGDLKKTNPKLARRLI